MQLQNNKQFILKYLELAGTQPFDWEKLEHYISERDQELKRHIEVFQAAMPGYILEPHDIIAEGNKVVVRFTIYGRHLGELMGHSPTGREINIDGIIIYEIEDYKIVNHWIQIDAFSLMQQLSEAKVSQEATA